MTKRYVDGDILSFPASGTEGCLVALLEVEWLFEGHLASEFKFLVEVFIHAAKTIIFLYEFNDVRVEAEHALVEFEIVNLFYGFGDLFCIVENAHTETIVAKAKGKIKAKIGYTQLRTRNR